MQRDKLRSILTMSKRAGKLVLGFDPVKDELRAGRAELVLSAADLSEKTGREIIFLSGSANIKVLELPFSMDEIWYMVGKRSGVLAIVDKGFAGRIESLIVND